MVPANTSSPGPLPTGSDSPVIGAWLTSLSPAATAPSSGIFSPGLTTSTSPMATLSIGTRTSRPSRCTRASLGESSIRARIARRARSMLRDSIHCASAKRDVTAAASDHSPMAIAPATAMSISVLMSRANRRAADQARLAQYQPPAAIDTANRARVTTTGASNHSSATPAAKAAPDATRNASRAPPGRTEMRDAVSWSSQARIPVAFTASAIAAAESCAASCDTRRVPPTTSALMASRPLNGLSRRSRMATSSWQSMPSTRNTDSAWISQTGQLGAGGFILGLSGVNRHGGGACREPLGAPDKRPSRVLSAARGAPDTPRGSRPFRCVCRAIVVGLLAWFATRPATVKRLQPPSPEPRIPTPGGSPPS